MACFVRWNVDPPADCVCRVDVAGFVSRRVDSALSSAGAGRGGILNFFDLLPHGWGSLRLWRPQDCRSKTLPYFGAVLTGRGGRSQMVAKNKNPRGAGKSPLKRSGAFWEPVRRAPRPPTAPPFRGARQMKASAVRAGGGAGGGGRDGWDLKKFRGLFLHLLGSGTTLLPPLINRCLGAPRRFGCSTGFGRFYISILRAFPSPPSGMMARCGRPVKSNQPTDEL